MKFSPYIYCPYIPLTIISKISPLPPGYVFKKQTRFHPAELARMKKYGGYDDYQKPYDNN
jgi:hypothetical protein